MESNVESTRGFFNDYKPFIDQGLQDRNKECFEGDESSAPASTSEIRRLFEHLRLRCLFLVKKKRESSSIMYMKAKYESLADIISVMKQNLIR